MAAVIRTAPRTAEVVSPLGAHVSTAGGVRNAPGRAAELGASAMQVFTKQPQRWAEPKLTADEIAAYREALDATGVRVVAAHDSYLINLATADRALFRRSEGAFRAELGRCFRLGIDFLVTHPGNATDGDRDAAIDRNAAAVTAALAERAGGTMVLFETTAGSGTALGWRFEELAALLDRVPPAHGPRVGVCLDTAHVFAAGYDLKSDYDGVIEELDAVIGLDRLRLIHLNDSARPLGSRKDRHAHIGEGLLGDAPFAALMRDPRLRGVPRVLETPRDHDPKANDLRNLERLRSLAAD